MRTFLAFLLIPTISQTFPIQDEDDLPYGMCSNTIPTPMLEYVAIYFPHLYQSGIEVIKDLGYRDIDLSSTMRLQMTNSELIRRFLETWIPMEPRLIPLLTKHIREGGKTGPLWSIEHFVKAIPKFIHNRSLLSIQQGTPFNVIIN